MFSVFIALFPYCCLKEFYHMHGLPLWLACSRLYIQAEDILNIDKVMFFFGKKNKPLPSATLECASAKGLCGTGQRHWTLHNIGSLFHHYNSYWKLRLSKHLFICLPLIVLTQLLYSKKKDFTSMVISRPDQVGRFHNFSPTLLRSRIIEINLHFCDASEFYNLLPSPFPYSTTLSWHK